MHNHDEVANANTKVIFIVGPPGTGKSTLAYHLANRLGYRSFLSGHALREAAKSAASPLKEEVSARLSRNQPMTVEVYCRVIEAAMRGKEVRGIVIDGYPGNTEQCVAIPHVLKAIGLSCARIAGLSLQAPRDVLLRRVSKRVVCASCGVDSQIRPVCCENPRFERRKDDSLNVFARRLVAYQAAIDSIVQTFTKRWSLWTIDASATVGQVVNTAVAALRDT